MRWRGRPPRRYKLLGYGRLHEFARPGRRVATFAPEFRGGLPCNEEAFGVTDDAAGGYFSPVNEWDSYQRTEKKVRSSFRARVRPCGRCRLAFETTPSRTLLCLQCRRTVGPAVTINGRLPDA